MKKILFISLSVLSHQFATGQCNCESLSGVMPANKTLSTGNCYEMSCYSVPDGKTLTIQPGVTIFVNSGGALYVERGGTINAAGTSSSPIVFTSNQTSGSHTTGFYDGVVIAGKATNNVSGGEVSLIRGCGYEGGGDDDHDNSGVFKYVQIHFSNNGFTLLSVGDGTEVNNIQVTRSGNDGFQFYGGTVNAKKLFSYNSLRNDFYFDNGNRSLLQELVGFRQDPAAHVAAGSYGARFQNDNSGTTNAPLTAPVIANLELIGPSFCTGGSLNSDFKDAIDVRLNAAPKIYNAVETRWPGYGLSISNTSTVANTASDDFNFSYNTLTNNGTSYYTSLASWSSGCDVSMTDWIDPSFSPPSCAEAGNQLVAMTLGYNTSSMCTSITNPDFTLGSSSPTMDAPDYTAGDLSPAFFSSLNSRGAFDATDWTNGWTDWDALNTDYCESKRMMVSDLQQQLQLSPNPASHATSAHFVLTQAGKVTITVANANDGKAIMTLPLTQMEAGSHDVMINTESLHSGVYIVRMVSGTQVLQQHLMIQ